MIETLDDLLRQHPVSLLFVVSSLPLRSPGSSPPGMQRSQSRLKTGLPAFFC